MTRLIISALLLLWATTANAQTLPSMDPLIGAWCFDDGNVAKRGMCADTPARRLIIRQDGYDSQQSSCDFVEVTRIRNGYKTFAECTLRNGDRRFFRSAFQLSGEVLHEKITFKSAFFYAQESCHLIGYTSDGYVNLRTGPGMQYKPKVKLVPGDVVSVDAANEEWSRVSVPRLMQNSKKVSGWVYSKCIEKDDASCHVP